MDATGTPARIDILWTAEILGHVWDHYNDRAEQARRNLVRNTQGHRTDGGVWITVQKEG